MPSKTAATPAMMAQSRDGAADDQTVAAMLDMKQTIPQNCSLGDTWVGLDVMLGSLALRAWIGPDAVRWRLSQFNLPTYR